MALDFIRLLCVRQMSDRHLDTYFTKPRVPPRVTFFLQEVIHASVLLLCWSLFFCLFSKCVGTANQGLVSIGNVTE